MITHSMTAAVSLALLAVPGAVAQVEFYSNTKNRTFVQTSADQPTTPTGFNFVYALFDSNASLTPVNVGTASVQRPDGSVVELNDSFGVFLTEFGGSFASEAELDLALPAGEYTYSITGGAFGDQQGSIVQLADNLWNDVPYVTNFDDVVDARAGEDLFVDFNDWTPDAGTTPDRSAIFWSLTNITTGLGVAGGSLSPNDTSEFNVDGSLLEAGDYRLSILFSARIDLFNVGFDGGANSTVAFDTITDLSFSIVPTPASAGLLALAGLAAARRRR